jgi:hypothetical protein
MSKARKTEAFDRVCDMQEDVDSIKNLARALIMMSADLEESYAGAVAEIAFHILDRADTIQRRRDKLFWLLHPNGAHLETVGWPDQDEEAA